MPAAAYQAKIEKIAAGGAGLARIGGKAAFVEGAAPGETVLCRISAERRSWMQAELLEIVEASPDRVQPQCPFYGKCGGCNLQHLGYEAQIAAKAAILEESFARIGGFSPPRPKIFPSPPWEYRNRVQLRAVPGQEAGFSWGFMARKGSQPVPVSDCPIADPGIRAMLREGGSINASYEAFPAQNPPRIAVYARNGLLLREGGISRGKTRVLDRELALDAGVFFQSNGIMLEKLISGLREIAETADRNLPMADLYCGVGTFSVFLGDLFPHIDLVEENKAAIALARENIAPFKSAACYAQPCGQWARGSPLGHYGFIAIDPPRQGMEAALARQLAAGGPPLLAYVSCDPATLARDSAMLRAGGYELAELRCYDFYPQTAHIESMALFRRIR